LAKKTKVSSKPAPKGKKSFDPESTPWFTPVAFAVIFLALVILFSSFIFSDKMLYGSDTIQAGVFYRSFYIDYFKGHGTVPQWNPYIFAGLPYVEAFHGDIFYPLSILKFFGSIYRMLGINLFLHIFLAGIFMYFAARQFKLSKVASLTSAVCYMFAGYLISLVAPGHDGKIFVTALFPLVIFFLDRLFTGKAFLNASLLGLVLGVIILTPHPQMSYLTMWAVALYALYKLIVLFREKRSLIPLIRPAVLTGYALVIALLVSAIQFYPGYIYTTNFSPRADAKRGWEWATSWSMHEEEAFSLIIPEFCGVSSQNTQTYYWGKNHFKDNSEAVGAVTFFLALLGLFISRRREKYFFGGLALFALLYALGATTPVFKLYYYVIPKVKALRAPAMIMFLFSFSSALLAGMGVHHLIDSKKKSKTESHKKFTYILFGWPILMLVLAFLFNVAGRGMLSLWSSLFYSEASTTQIQKGITKLDLAYYNLPAIQSGCWFAFLFVTLAALFVWLYRYRQAGISVLVGLALLPVIDGVRFNRRFVSTFDQNQMWSPNPVTEFFTQREGHFRVVNFSQTLSTDLLPFHHIEVVTGYHGNQLRWFDKLLGGPSKKNMGNPRLLNLVGTRYLLLPAQQQLPPDALGEKPLLPVGDFGSVQVYQNDNAFPRVYLSDRYEVLSDLEAIDQEVLNGSENLREVVYLEETPDIKILPADTSVEKNSTDSTWVISHAIDSVLVGVSCSRNRLLVLTDNYYDAWHVYVDNTPAKLLRAYGSFRAVAVPAGTRQVLFKYNSERYRVGKLTTLLTSLYLVVVFGVYFIRSKLQKKLKQGNM
jgi:hypothetical protein